MPKQASSHVSGQGQKGVVGKRERPRPAHSVRCRRIRKNRPDGRKPILLKTGDHAPAEGFAGKRVGPERQMRAVLFGRARCDQGQVGRLQHGFDLGGRHLAEEFRTRDVVQGIHGKRCSQWSSGRRPSSSLVGVGFSFNLVLGAAAEFRLTRPILNAGSPGCQAAGRLRDLTSGGSRSGGTFWRKRASATLRRPEAPPRSVSSSDIDDSYARRKRSGPGCMNSSSMISNYILEKLYHKMYISRHGFLILAVFVI